MYLLAPFILQNVYKNNLRVDSELSGCAPFLGPKQLICLEQNFFGINHCCYFHPPMAPFIGQNFFKNLTMDPELWRSTIFGPKVVPLPQIIFFQKPVLFMPIYMPKIKVRY